MDAALDKWTRKLISASSAREISFGLYLCPNCLEPVHLRAGLIRVAHFAHNQGAARSECELYVQSIIKRGGLHAEHLDQDRRAGEMKLGLRLYSRVRPMSWGLELDLSVKDMSEGQVLIDVGGREVEVDLAGNRSSSYTVIGEPQQAPYRILSVSPSHCLAAILAGQTCEGLRETGITAFAAVGRAEHVLFYRTEKMGGGRTYAVVWRNGQDACYPDEWERELLETRGEFSAALIFVPRFLTPENIEWIEENLQYTVEHEIPNIVQVWPPVSERITSQSIKCIRDNPIVVTLDEADASQATSMFVRCEGDERAAGGIPDVKAFFRYQPEGKTNARFLTPGAYGAMLDVEFSLRVPVESYTQSTVVMLKVSLYEGDNSVSVALHDQRVVQVLLNVRHGRAKLDSVSMPRAAQGQIRIGMGDSVVEYPMRASDQRVPNQACGFQPTNEDLGRLNGAICELGEDVIIDFGALGYVSFPAEANSKGSSAFVELPEQVRMLLKKYLFQFGQTLLWPRPDARMSDLELVHLFSRGRWSTRDSVTRRYLERELSRYFDEIPQ